MNCEIEGCMLRAKRTIFHSRPHYLCGKHFKAVYLITQRKLKR
jgi:hypothetical protein